MAYTPPPGDAATFSLSGGYVAPAGNAATFALGDALELVETGCSVELTHGLQVDAGCTVDAIITGARVDAGVEVITSLMAAEVGSGVDVYRPHTIEAVTAVIRSDARLINQSVQIVRRAAALAEQPCEVVRASMAGVESGCAVLLAAASALVEAGVLVERESLSRTPVESWCEIITIDSSMPASGATGQTMAGAVSGATTPEGVPVAAGSYTAADLAAGLVIDLGNSALDPIGISLTIDRGAYAITGTLELGTEAEFAACTIGRDIALQIGAEPVQLRVADRKRSRAHGQWRYTVELQSPSAWLDAPWAEQAAGTYSGTAASIAASLAAGAEHPVALAWQTVSWPIPADTVLANGSSPLELIRQIKDAAGAVLQSLPDGSLVVEPEYPVALPQWAATAPSYTVVEAAEVVSAEDDADWRDGSNAYLVGNVSAGNSSAGGDIRISEVDNPDGGKSIRVATVPWNPSMRLSHRGGTWVQLSGLGDRSRQETETVQVVDGVGRLQYRFDGLVASDYLEAELGAISIAEEGTITTATLGDTLIALTYTTRSRDYQLINPRAEEVMVVAEADDAAVDGVGAVSVLVTRGDGLNQGQEFTSDLITTAEVAMEKGRNLIDATCSPRQLVTLLMPYRGIWRTGRIVSVHDATLPPWVGMLRSQQINISVADDGSQTWDSTITLEREAA